MALGKYPDITLADARRLRDEARALFANGVDPVAHRTAKRQKEVAETHDTFYRLSEELLEKKRKEGCAEATLKKTEWFHRLLCADIGAMPISQITAQDVLLPLRKVEPKGNFESAIRMRSAAGAVFRYAIALGKADNDPTFGLKDALMASQSFQR